MQHYHDSQIKFPWNFTGLAVWPHRFEDLVHLRENILNVEFICFTAELVEQTRTYDL